MSVINQIQVGSTTYDIQDAAAVPSSRTINGKALSSNITLNASDVGAMASTYTAPVTSVNGNTGAVVLSIPSVATATPLMDGTAAVGTATKYAREDHKHPSDMTKLNKTAELQTTNPFAPESLRGIYISKIDNAFYAADKRWTITSTNTSGSLANLFDGDYESQVTISNGNTAVITMDFSNEPSGYFPSYPYGYILVSFYYNAKPTSVSGRVYCNYAAQGIGWKDISFDPMTDNTTNNNVYKSQHQGYYNISQIEITIVGDTTNSAGNTKVTQIEMHLDRPYSGRNPFLSKYSSETLYYDLTAPKFIGALQGNADTATSATKATQDESGNNIKASYAASMSLSGTTLSLLNKNSTALSTVTLAIPSNAADVGAVPTTRKVNNKALSSDITLAASDVGAVPTSRTVNGKSLNSNISLTAADVGALASTYTAPVTSVNGSTGAVTIAVPTVASDVGAVPTSRAINGYALSSDVTLTASDVGAMPSTHTVVRLYGVTCNANSAVGDFATVNNAAITANHVVANIIFSKPNYIRSDVTWTTTDGTFTLNGRCYTATTADIILVYNDVLVS